MYTEEVKARRDLRRRERRAANLEQARKHDREYMRVFWRRHKEYRKERVRRQRQKILSLLGGKCVRCGFNDVRALQIDHVNGGGAKEVRGPKLRGHIDVYYNKVLRSIVAGDGKYQLLCANCNWIKRAENHEVYDGVVVTATVTP